MPTLRIPLSLSTASKWMPTISCTKTTSAP
nr:MAG TPA: hypothetical protein [Caudoviricetes sp.]